MAGLAQPQGLRDVHDAQPVCPARDGSRPGLGDAVPVPVGLDDGHDQAAGIRRRRVATLRVIAARSTGASAW